MQKKVLEQIRNARRTVETSSEFTRIQCWNTIEMHASKMLEHSRNARPKYWNTVDMQHWNTVLEHSRNARPEYWHAVEMQYCNTVLEHNRNVRRTMLENSRNACKKYCNTVEIM